MGIDQGTYPVEDEELISVGHLVLRLATGKSKIEAYIRIAGLSKQGTLIVEYGMGHIVHAIVAVAEIVVDKSILAMGKNMLVYLSGTGIVFLLICAVGLCLGLANSGHKREGKKCG